MPVPVTTGRVIAEGKTKVIRELPDRPGHVLIVSKDRITAGDGARANELEGKSAVSNRTAALVFGFLNEVGVKNHFVELNDDTSFVARHCNMIPIEFVARRLATGSFLKRNPGVPEKYRFAPLKLETFFKDDANHDPQWSNEQILSAVNPETGKPLFQYQTKKGTVTVDADKLSIMLRQLETIFEILEKAWQSRDCTLVDMKIEFGVDVETGEIFLADMIDSDSWRLWPHGDKSQMKDKQVYRDMKEVSNEALQVVKKNFQWIEDELKQIVQHKPKGQAWVFMGSAADLDFCKKIQSAIQKYGLTANLRVSSAHKATDDTLRFARSVESEGNTVFVAVAGRSNGLGPVLSGNVRSLVFNVPPPSDGLTQDIWSSLRLPSGLGCVTVLDPENAGLAVATHFGQNDFRVWAKIAAKQLNQTAGVITSNQNI